MLAQFLLLDDREFVPVLRSDLAEVGLDDGGVGLLGETALVGSHTEVLLALGLEEGVERALLAVGEADRGGSGLSNAGGHDDRAGIVGSSVRNRAGSLDQSLECGRDSVRNRSVGRWYGSTAGSNGSGRALNGSRSAGHGGSRASSRTGHALRVPVVELGAACAVTAGRLAGEAVSTALAPGLDSCEDRGGLREADHGEVKGGSADMHLGCLSGVGIREVGGCKS
jgi:hypothetical protein